MKKLFGIIILLVVCNAIYFSLDYFNLPTLLGINVTNINWDLAALIVGNTVVVGLFLITYLLIDKKQIEKEKNQMQSAYLILNHTYLQCEVTVESFCESEFRNKFCSFKSTKELFKDVEKVQVLEYAFKNEDALIEFVKAGILNPDLYNEYLDIKMELSAFLSVVLGAKSEVVVVERMGCDLMRKINAEQDRIEELISTKEGCK